MLILDKSLPHIEVDAQDIIALYRSSAAVSLPSGNFGPGQWLAYLCGVQEQNDYAVFMALLNANTRKIHVYTLDEHPENRDEYAKILQDSVKFAEEMGFSMQNINIDYSRALREVIISDTKVIKPAKHGKKSIVRKGGESREKIDETGKSESKPSAHQSLHLLKNVKNIVADEQASDKNASPGGLPDASRGPGKHSEAAPAPGPVSGKVSKSDAELRQLSAEKAERENESAKQVGEAMSEPDRLKAELADMDKRTLGELQKLRKEAERIAEEKAAAEKTASDAMAAAKAGVENLAGELSLFREKAGEELAALKAEAKKLSEQKDAAERAAAEELAAARAEAVKLLAEIEEVRNRSREKIGGYMVDAERLKAEKLAMESTLDGDLAAAEADMDALSAEMSCVEKSAVQKLHAIRAEVEKLKAEKAEAEAKYESILAEARGEIDRLAGEIKTIEASTGQAMASLLEEVERLGSEKDTAEKEGIEKVEAAKAAVAALVAEKAAVEETLEEQLSAIRKEEETMTAGKKAAEKEAEKTFAEARDRIDRLSAEIIAYEAASAEKLARLLDEENRLKDENIAAEKEASVKMEAAKEELEKIAAEKVSAEELQKEQLAAVLEAARKLSAEKDSAENAFSGQIAVAVSGLERVISETIYSVNSIVGKLVDLKSRAEGFISELEAVGVVSACPEIISEKVTMIEKPVKKADSGDAVVKKAAAEKKEPAPETGKEGAVTEKQVNDGIPREKVQENTHPAMKFGEETLSVEKALADLSGPVVDGSAKESGKEAAAEADENSDAGPTAKATKAEESETVEEDVFPLLATEEIHDEGIEADEDDNDFATGFHIDKSLGKIEYGPKDEIIDVYQSLNIARITPEGYLAQNSRAYVCAMKKRGTMSVFIGLQLTDNDNVLVYIPEKQPKSRNFRKTVQDAIDFLETAGFLMDHMSLGNDPKTREKIIGKIPVLSGAH